MLRMVTIGVYGFDGESFLQRLRHADVRLLLDVRQRRGVRGPEYAWANSLRLQAALAQARIAYEHHPELAPTTDLRQLQYAEDDRQGVGKRSRRELAAEYTRRYTTGILDRADLTPIVSELSSSGTAALLCVERDPEACHRSLIAQRLTEQHHVTIELSWPFTSSGVNTWHSGPKSARIRHRRTKRPGQPEEERADRVAAQQRIERLRQNSDAGW